MRAPHELSGSGGKVEDGLVFRKLDQSRRISVSLSRSIPSAYSIFNPLDTPPDTSRQHHNEGTILYPSMMICLLAGFLRHDDYYYCSLLAHNWSKIRYPQRKLQQDSILTAVCPRSLLL